MFDRVSQDQLRQIREATQENSRELGEIEISSSGTRIAHGLRTMPKWIQVIPYKHRGVVSTLWWYYQKPDATYIYIQAGVTGRFLVTVGG